MTAPQTSWIDSANDGQTHFPLQNLPYGVFSVKGQSPRVGVAIGDQILDLAALDDAGLLPAAAKGTFAGATLNRFIALGKPAWTEARKRLTALLSGEDGAFDGVEEGFAHASGPIERTGANERFDRCPVEGGEVDAFAEIEQVAEGAADLALRDDGFHGFLAHALDGAEAKAD